MLRVERETFERIAEHLGGIYPEEGCGVLVGSERHGARAIGRAVACDNASPAVRARRYTIAPEAFLSADRAARADGLEVLGFYHSHPDQPAAPSRVDVEEAWPYYSYLIVSVAAGRVSGVSAFRLAEDGSKLEPEALEIVPRPAAQTG